MRRILAYSIVNQVGFMVTGIGIGTATALNGAASHAFAHILYKALLLMSAGAVLHATRSAQVHRPGRALPHDAADHPLRDDRRAGDLGVPAHVGLRQQVDDRQRGDGGTAQPSCGTCSPPPPRACSCTPASSTRGSCSSRRTPACGRPTRRCSMRLAMMLFAALCIGLGIWYAPLYALLPFPVDYVPYTGAHVVGPAAAAAVLGTGILRHAAGAAAHLDDHARHRLAVPETRTGARAGGAGRWIAPRTGHCAGPFGRPLPTSSMPAGAGRAAIATPPARAPGAGWCSGSR